jgi:hypothetical protein
MLQESVREGVRMTGGKPTYLARRGGGVVSARTGHRKIQKMTQDLKRNTKSQYLPTTTNEEQHPGCPEPYLDYFPVRRTDQCRTQVQRRT